MFYAFAACAGGQADFVEVDGRQMLGPAATAAQVLQLLNHRPRKQKRRQTTVKVGKVNVELHSLYNLVQAHGGKKLVRI